MTKGNALLRDEEVEMLIILRMNRHFMEFMRAEYPDVCKVLASQKFGKTVVQAEE